VYKGRKALLSRLTSSEATEKRVFVQGNRSSENVSRN
jgi:hypothetical protein